MDLFHEGDIQSGIATALQQDKCVVCFIRDDTPESEQWLAWIQDHHIPSQLQKNAITLRIQAGSDEAQAFSTFSPIPRTPMVSVIYKGAVVEQLVLGISKNEFILRLLRSISPSQRSQPAAAPALSQQQQDVSSVSSNTPQNPPSSSIPAQEVAEPSPAPSDRNTTSEPSANAKGKQRAKENDKTAEKPAEKAVKVGSAHSDAQKYAKQNVDRKKEMRAEKERVRALVENDKKERRLREERRKAERLGTVESSELPDARPNIPSSASGFCAVRVRLLDGSTISSTFSAKEQLASTIRPWVVKERTDGNLPFKFKQILTPHPSRTIPPEDEQKSLQELGLAPSANLVLVPVKKVTSAYSDSTLGSVQGFFAKIYAFLASFILTIINFVMSVFSTPPSAPASQPQQQPRSRNTQANAGASDTAETTQSDAASSSAGNKIRIRTLADQRTIPTEDQQLYNGNQLNFEPKQDDENKDE